MLLSQSVCNVFVVLCVEVLNGYVNVSQVITDTLERESGERKRERGGEKKKTRVLGM